LRSRAAPYSAIPAPEARGKAGGAQLGYRGTPRGQVIADGSHRHDIGGRHDPVLARGDEGVEGIIGVGGTRAVTGPIAEVAAVGAVVEGGDVGRAVVDGEISAIRREREDAGAVEVEEIEGRIGRRAVVDVSLAGDPAHDLADLVLGDRHGVILALGHTRGAVAHGYGARESDVAIDRARVTPQAESLGFGAGDVELRVGRRVGRLAWGEVAPLQRPRQRRVVGEHAVALALAEGPGP